MDLESFGKKDQKYLVKNDRLAPLQKKHISHGRMNQATCSKSSFTGWGSYLLLREKKIGNVTKSLVGQVFSELPFNAFRCWIHPHIYGPKHSDMVHIEMQENLSDVGTACTLNALPRDRTGCHKNKRNNEPRKYLTVIYIHSHSAEPVINGTVGMKFLHILFMKRHRAGERSHVDSSRKSIYSRILIRKKRAETGHTWDESTTSQESDGAPWRIENILIDGAPRGADWWQDTVHRRGSAEVEAQAQQNDEGGSTQAEEINIETTFEESHGEELKSFRNCGLETWVQVQQAWRRPSGMETGRARIPVRKLKQELVKRMSEYRKFDLPHRLPLKDVIEAYTETWDGESD